MNNDIDAKWREEVENRVTAFKAGEIPADTAENVFKRLFCSISSLGESCRQNHRRETGESAKN
ncbi:MAG: hypothetical protein ABIJ14_02095 [Nanoarchaeota archaeon]